MNSRGVNNILLPESLLLGGKTISQSLPTKLKENHDPFLLLHHAGPYNLKKENAQFYVGPHPHRGFEPITFVFQGGVRHKDSLGNDSSIEAPGAQWISAARGIIHSEHSSEQFENKGGNFELIQLWVNLPAELKMKPATYTKCDADELIQIPIPNSPDSKLYLVAGTQGDYQGAISSRTSVNALMAYLQTGAKVNLSLNEKSACMVYVLGGSISIGNKIIADKQLAILENKGSKLEINCESDSRLLILEGQKINEEIVSWGPYVMNTQREIMEAMRDYNQGKMGFLAS
jgi:redox-sensitive bicupin YhaK (pirin superfamily)